MKTKTGMLFLIYSLAAIAVSSVIRFFQYVSIIDFSTGFYIMGSETAGCLIYIILAAFGLGFAALTIIGHKKKWTATTVSSDGMGSKATLIPGVAYLIAAVVQFVGAMNLDNAGFFRVIGSYALAISFAALGLCLMKSTVPPAVTGFINLLPALYFFTMATTLFTTDLTVKNRSDSLILLLTLVVGTLFFAAVARFFARLETRHSRSRELITSGFAFILSGTHVLSKLLAYAFGGDAVSGIDSISFDALVLMVISGAFIITVCTAKQSKEIDYLLPDEKEKDEKTEK